MERFRFSNCFPWENQQENLHVHKLIVRKISNKVHSEISEIAQKPTHELTVQEKT